MSSIIQPLAAQLGIWASILLFLIAISYLKAKTNDQATALGQPWFGKAAAATAALAVITHFAQLCTGRMFVAWSGGHPWIHTGYLLLALAAIALTLYGYRARESDSAAAVQSSNERWPYFLPVIACIAGLNMSLSPGLGPQDAPLSQYSSNGDRAVIIFAQERLQFFGCFDAAREEDGYSEGDFDPPTTAAVISFQLSNHVFEKKQGQKPARDLNRLGWIRSNPEFRLLAQPFPWLGEPARCPKPRP